jgi:hypothetical protein
MNITNQSLKIKLNSHNKKIRNILEPVYVRSHEYEVPEENVTIPVISYMTKIYSMNTLDRTINKLTNYIIDLYKDADQFILRAPLSIEIVPVSHFNTYTGDLSDCEDKPFIWLWIRCGGYVFGPNREISEILPLNDIVNERCVLDFDEPLQIKS